MNQAKTWCSCHIFHHGDMDRLIINVVPSVINQCENLFGETEWFFIRYWLGGPHLRLRIKAENDKWSEIEEILQIELNKYIANTTQMEIDKETLFKQNKKMTHLETEQEEINIYDNNSVIRFDYVPEYFKYGGENGICISENHFMSSSTFSQNILSKGIGKSEKLFIAMECMFNYLKMQNFSKENMMIFFRNYISLWEDYLNITGSDMAIQINKKALEQVGNCSDQIASILNSESSYIPESVYLQWSSQLTETVAKLSNIFGPIGCENYEIVKVVLNYMHVHNNRLGVSPAEEIYLATILYESLKQKLK